MIPFVRSLALIFVTGLAASVHAASIDLLVLGDSVSERAHQLDGAQSETIIGDLGEPARRLLPLEPAAWNGGTLSFILKVDPAKPNYITAKFSGNEVTQDRLMLHVEGRQIGWRHLGEVEQIDYGTWAPAYNGRFYYNTSPLPPELTQGKTEVRVEIRSSGRIWGYGGTFDKYQKNMTRPSRGIYRVYSHTDGCFVPSADEKQGAAPSSAPVRPAPGPEVLDQVKTRVNRELDTCLSPHATPDQMQLQLLAKAYDVKWTSAHQNPETLTQILKGLDALYLAYVKNPRLAQADPSTWNPEWFGLGVCGQVIALRYAQLAPKLDERINHGKGGRITRRVAFTDMLIACRDWHRLNRRQYTNQSMINDLNGIYFANRGIAVLTPSKALPETAARRYLYESVGIEPWRDSDDGGRKWNVGENYLQLTAKGLTKELGYVGSYGEVTDLVADIYDATRPAHDQPGDPKIKAQLVKIALARAAFRHPSLDEDGNRAMRMEQVVGWRDSHYPGYIVYAQRATRDASALQVAALTLDPQLVGYAQQMLADNQFFASEVEAMADSAQPLRTTIGRLHTPDHYELIQSLAPAPHRLPMSWDQPDFVFTDEENGVLALKNGSEIIYASLYWRARYGINNLARVHYLTPVFDRIAVVRQKTQFTPQGLDYVTPDWTNMAFGNGGLRYPGNPQSAQAGQVHPIAKIPDVIPFRAGQESPYAGRGDFYTLHYGSYLIGMNMSTDKTFDIEVPSGIRSAADLTSRRAALAPGTLRKVGPRSTVVILLGE